MLLDVIVVNHSLFLLLSYNVHYLDPNLYLNIINFLDEITNISSIIESKSSSYHVSSIEL